QRFQRLLIYAPPPLAAHEIVKLRDTVSQLGRPRNAARGQLADRDVIGMPVRAVWIERHHHVRLHAPDVAGNFLGGFDGIDTIEITVVIVEKAHLAHAKLARRCAELLFACAADDGRTWRLLVAVT